MKRLIVILVALFVLPAWAESTRSNSLFQQSRRQAQIRQMRGNAPAGVVVGGPGTPVSQVTPNPATPADRVTTTSVHDASWLSVDKPSPKGFRVHDLVTIVVNEVSSHSSKAETSTQRDASIDAALEEWFTLTKGGIRLSDKAHGQPQIKASTKQEFDGEGDVSRKDSLIARIQAEVIDIKPNGNLLLEATHTVTTDDETTIITLTGTCRSKDVGFDNMIQSSCLARLNVVKIHKGTVRDATKQGWLTRLFGWLNPI